MRVEENDDGTAWIFETVRNLADHHNANRSLFRIDGSFFWRHPGADDPIATAADFFGESELDFAPEYLLLHGNDEISLPWEDDRPEDPGEV